ncbi:MAG TPA: type II toxin-antitoxin system VapC family toxin [Tepidiformaceae bacterium]|jgi:predicted nucleic-acid-binding protein|nr:type II toxin-antitoxin system VapC family toxin [Tepidiformaceae bacterium]
MIAVDTNVLARLIVGDDPAQAKRATALFRHEEVFIPKTVLLELEWVLRGAYRIERPLILRALLGILGLPNVTAEDGARVASALRDYEAGLDFADALHIASSIEASRFVTFDEKLRKRAKSLKGMETGAP